MAKVLIVEDNLDMLEALENLLTFYDFEVLKAKNGREGIDIAEAEQPGVIILDALMPVMNGFEACKYLKENPRTRDIPIIFLSANYTDDEYRVRGLELGADDYMLKPFNAKELVAKVNALLQKKQLIDKLKQDNQVLREKSLHFHQEIETLRQKTSQLISGQTTDPLTGLYNDVSFRRRFQEEYSRSVRYGSPLSLVLIDVDHFQKINEAFGEKAGDYVLTRAANVILNNTRSCDVVFRLTRDKFAVLLPNTSEKGAFYEAERIRSAIFQKEFFSPEIQPLKTLSPQRRQELQRVSVSVGIAEREGESDRDELLRRAEFALGIAKSRGRNSTVRYAEVEPSRTTPVRDSEEG
ncbi:MAG: diguanylate cyclase [Calditrichaeota bacterium]|nr:MAG: diguanylate cyclase [Calditrichota bacterium]